jgi:pyruvate dehydrogenase E2 component (dihydrolipoamide acetyltransferase)
MAFEITLPRLGWDMEEGSLADWLKKDGEFVNTGELLFTVEGDKAIQEIEALDSGYLKILPNGPQKGEKVPVGTLLGYLVPEKELAEFHFPGRVPEPVATQAIEARTTVQPTGHPSEEPVLLPADGRKRRVYISPYAKRLAKGLGVDWQDIRGSGKGGRIMALDIERAAEMKRETAAPAPLPATIPPVPAATAMQPTAMQVVQFAAARQAITPLRRKIAEHMAYSAHTSAPVTLTTEVDATELVGLRKALKEDSAINGQLVPSFNDLFAKLSSQALLEHPLVNARIDGEEIVQGGTVNIAIAVDTERGLIVPVLRDVQTKTLRQLARESSALIERTRDGSITYEELQGATFTITNLGMFEIDAFTPIIDLPQCAILGVGRIAPKQVVVEVETEKVGIRQCVVLSLTFDHRLVDGAQAARFLQRIKRFIEHPYLWMAG